MPKIIRDGQIVEDAWIRVCTDADQPDTQDPQAYLLPLHAWLEESTHPSRAPWLASDTELTDALAASLMQAPLIGIDFPDFNDGRGYTLARQLRTRYQYQGEIRALGDVLQDQLFYMQRVGFNAFALRADKDIQAALQALKPFSVCYQAASDQALPLFIQRAQSA